LQQPRFPFLEPLNWTDMKMATRLFCDCGCEKALSGYDAGAAPVRVKSVADIEVEITVLPGEEGRKRNLRPSCVREIIARGEIICPPDERKVVLLRALGAAAGASGG
jgi:hypothetical protein